MTIRNVALRGIAAAAFLACIGLGATGARAGTVINSGDTIDGWKITFPVGIGLFEDGVSANGTLDIEKEAAFTSMEGLVITFVQASPTAAPDISVVNENLTNATGSDWNGFQFLLTSPLAPALPAATFTGTFNEITPFTTSVPTGTDTITLGGGTVSDGTTALLGYDPNGGDLTFATHPAGEGMMQVITLKELPTGGSTPPSVPLPAAAWSGLTGLLGLSLLSTVRKLRKVIA